MKKVYLQHRSKRIKKPPVAVNLLLILLFHTEYNLRRHDSLVRVAEVEVRVERERRGVLEDVGGDRPVVDHVFHVATGLVDAEESEAIEDAGMHLFAPVGNDADYDLIDAGQAELVSGFQDRKVSLKRTFFQASLPQVWEFFLEHKWAMF